jgi:hypothetical protein
MPIGDSERTVAPLWLTPNLSVPGASIVSCAVTGEPAGPLMVHDCGVAACAGSAPGVHISASAVAPPSARYNQ